MKKGIIILLVLMFAISTVYAFDTCATAVATGEVVDLAFDTTTATTSGFDTHSINQDIWYVYTASSDGELYLGTCDSSFDTKLAVYGACDVTTEIGYNDDSCGGGSEIIPIFPVISGEDYFIQVGGYGSNFGTGLLDIILIPASGPAFNPIPLDAAIDITISTDLAWTSLGTTFYVSLWDDAMNMVVDNVMTNDPFFDILNDLGSDMLYHWRVDTDWGAGVEPGTEWSFTTIAAATAYPIPYAETFDGPGVPAYWTIDPIVAGDSWEMFTANPGHGAPTEHTGNGGAYIGVDDSSPETVPAHLYSPEIDLTGATLPYLTFYYWIGDDPLYIGSTLNIDIDDGTMLTSDVLVVTETFDHWEMAAIDLTPWLNQTITIDFRAMESASYYGDICLDDVNVINAAMPPAATTPVAPADMALDVPIVTNLAWNVAGFADGYYLSFGTDDPPTNLANAMDLGDVTFYDPASDLVGATMYYWQIVPYNTYGSAAACPVWSFTTGAVATLPIVEDFENGAPGWKALFNLIIRIDF